MILKCKMCGGDLVINEGAIICECEYCGTKQTVPKADDEKKMVLFERANRLRFNCEFDKAASVYESIVAEYRQEAEGYWGLVLCKYGIEYVDDPATGKKVPTCHRSSFDSIMEDADFELVMENSDELSRQVYRQQAKDIEEVRKGIIEVSGKEEPYDIFICYKETDSEGNRTIDSVIAQDVYDALIEKGYRVFFSRITLEDKLGIEYEPYIFAALNSAKIMLAFGTTYDYYNAVWVKNEWSRYLKIMAKDKGKYLIPCYKDIDAYDMPKEFAKLQSQDMGKVGAMQDLLRGIAKIIDIKKEVTEKVVVEKREHNTDSLIRRGFIFIENKEWENADSVFEKVLNEEPENAEAYLGKLLCEKYVSSVDELENQTGTLNLSTNYQNLIRFGSEDIKSKLTEINDRLNARNIERIRLLKYTEACKLFNNAKTVDDYEKAKEEFLSVKDYERALDFIERSNQKIAELNELEDRKRKKRKKQIKVALVMVVALVIIVAGIIVYQKAIYPAIIKSRAEEAIASENYDEGYKLFAEIMSEKEAKDIVSQSKYETALRAIDAKDYDKAVYLLEQLNGYKDSNDKLNEAKYSEAFDLRKAGDFDKAIKIYEQLGEYGDSQNLLIDTKYEYALSEAEKKNYEKAINILKELENDKDVKKDILDTLICELKDSESDDDKTDEIIEEILSVSEEIGNSDDIKHTLAMECKNIGKLMWSYKLYYDLGDKNNADALKREMLQKAQRGDRVIFGKIDTKKEWIVVAREDNKLLLLNSGIVYKSPFDSHKQTDWKSSELRVLLNTTYYKVFFDDEERKSILKTMVNNTYGEDTNDYIFILSRKEISEYKLTQEESCVSYNDKNSPWWVRDMRESCHEAFYIDRFGESSGMVGMSINAKCGVRPALWIDISDIK